LSGSYPHRNERVFVVPQFVGRGSSPASSGWRTSRAA